MKALVLSGGSGTRLRPFTHTSAKQLVPLANKPVLFHGLESIAAVGITEVGMVVGAADDAVREACGDGSRFGLDITYIVQEQPLGLAHAVLIARNYLGDDDFLMHLGDNFIEDGIADLVNAFRREQGDGRIMVSRVEDPCAFGVAELDAGNRLTGVQEKPAHPRSDLAIVGVYLFTSHIHKAVEVIRPSERGELEITDAIQYLLDLGGDVRCTLTEGFWKDTGTATGMLEANRTVLESLKRRIDGDVDARSQTIGRVVVEEGAHVVDSRIVGPALIGAGTLVSGSYVGPFTSVAENCRIVDSEVEYSILLPEAAVHGVGRIGSSLIGRNAEVSRSSGTPRTHRLLLGDHSRIRIGT